MNLQEVETIDKSSTVGNVARQENVEPPPQPLTLRNMVVMFVSEFDTP